MSETLATILEGELINLVLQESVTFVRSLGLAEDDEHVHAADVEAILAGYAAATAAFLEVWPSGKTCSEVVTLMMAGLRDWVLGHDLNVSREEAKDILYRKLERYQDLLPAQSDGNLVEMGRWIQANLKGLPLPRTPSQGECIRYFKSLRQKAKGVLFQHIQLLFISTGDGKSLKL